MKKNDIIDLFRVITACYPNTGKSFADVDTTTRDCWFDMLKDIDISEATFALKQHISRNQFPPTIADIRNGALALSPQVDTLEDGEQSWVSAVRFVDNWGDTDNRLIAFMRQEGEELVRHSKVIYRADEFKKLSKLTQKTINSIGYATIDERTSTQTSIIRAQYINTFKIFMQREKESACLPTFLMQQIDANKSQYKQLQESSNPKVEKPEIDIIAKISKNIKELPREAKEVYNNCAERLSNKKENQKTFENKAKDIMSILAVMESNKKRTAPQRIKLSGSLYGAKSKLTLKMRGLRSKKQMVYFD